MGEKIGLISREDNDKVFFAFLQDMQQWTNDLKGELMRKRKEQLISDLYFAPNHQCVIHSK